MYVMSLHQHMRPLDVARSLAPSTTSVLVRYSPCLVNCSNHPSQYRHWLTASDSVLRSIARCYTCKMSAAARNPRSLQLYLPHILSLKLTVSTPAPDSLCSSRSPTPPRRSAGCSCNCRPTQGDRCTRSGPTSDGS